MSAVLLDHQSEQDTHGKQTGAGLSKCLESYSPRCDDTFKEHTVLQ